MSEKSSRDCFNSILHIIESSPTFLGCAFVLKNDILVNIDKIYAVLPVEVIERKQQNVHKFNEKIYDNLKNFEILLDDSPRIFGLTVLRLRDVSILLQSISADLESIN